MSTAQPRAPGSLMTRRWRKADSNSPSHLNEKLRQIVDQHIEANAEQVAPAPDQMIEQGLLVFAQPG